MRAPLLVLLVLAVATAPLAMVPTSVGSPEAEAGAETGTQESPDPERDPDKPHLPEKTSWSELNPGHQPKPGTALDDETDAEQRPELPPALYARRLAAAPLPTAPPHDPPRADLRAGHLALPPPVA